jgi:hypothetical protein
MRKRHRKLIMMAVLIAAVTGASGKTTEQFLQIGFDWLRSPQKVADYSTPIDYSTPPSKIVPDYIDTRVPHYTNIYVTDYLNTSGDNGGFIDKKGTYANDYPAPLKSTGTKK